LTTAAAPADNLTQEDAERRAELISKLEYIIELTLSNDPSVESFRSVTSVVFDVARDDADTFIDLSARSVEEVALNGRVDEEARRAYDGVRLPLRGLRRGRNELRVVADCTYYTIGVGLHRLVDPIDHKVYVYTHFEPFDAHKVFPCFDQPDLKGTFTLQVTAPPVWSVCADSRVIERQSVDGATRWSFNRTPLIPTYLVAIVAGEFHIVRDEHRGIPLSLWCRESLAEYLDQQAADIFEITKQGLDFFRDYFGLEYPFDEYNQLFVPEASMGAMENPGCVTFNELYIFRGKATENQLLRRAETILHEMAHVHGFGDVATMRWWGDLWLNETFATYMSQLAIDDATRFDNAWVDFANTVKSVAARQDQLVTTHRIADSVPDTDSVRQNFDGITYHKGASVMRQLAAWVGDDAFRAGVQDYFRRYRWGNATLQNFLECIGRASGRDMASWSRQWLETTGMNVLRPEFEVRDGRYAWLDVVQGAAKPEHPTLRSHRIAVGLYDLHPDGALRLRAAYPVDVDGERTRVGALAGIAAADLVLVNDADLTFAKLRFDERSVHTLLDHLSALEDSLARSLCWAALWDMTRDAELPTRRYVELVTRHAKHEEEPALIERVLSQALAATDQFSDPSNRNHLRALLQASAREQIDSLPKDAVLRLSWTRCLIATSVSPKELDFLAALVEERERIEGVPLDTDLRWLAVARLATTGRYGVAEISAALELDPTDFGRRHAAASLAARPDATAKAEAWQIIREPSGMIPEAWQEVLVVPVSLATLAAIMRGFAFGAFVEGGFHRSGQEDVLRPYIASYAEQVPRMWKERSIEDAEEFTESMYPRYLTDDALIDAVDRTLALPGLPGAARRILQEGRDGTLRARRAREADAAAASTAMERSGADASR
jgi:aminopeptidase N